MVPLRFVSEALGDEVAWKEETREVTIRSKSIVITLAIDRKRAVVDGKEIDLDEAPIMKDGSTLVPLRFIAESLNQKVDFNAASNFSYSDKTGAKHSVTYPELIPVKLFLDEAGNRVYMLSSIVSWDSSATMAVHQIYPNVEMEAYQVASSSNYQQTNFVVTKDGNQFYFSDLSQKSILKADKGSAGQYIGDLPMPGNPGKEDWVSLVAQDTIYVFSKELKSLYKLMPGGSLQLLKQLDEPSILSVAGRNGSFYYKAKQQLFQLNVDGTVKKLADFGAITFKPHNDRLSSNVMNSDGLNVFSVDNKGNLYFLSPWTELLTMQLYEK